MIKKNGKRYWIPDLRTVVVASGGASVIAALLRIGRGMRMSDNKSSCVVVDVYDKGEYFLENQSKKRKKAYENAGHDVSVIFSDEIENLLFEKKINSHIR